MGFGVYKIQKKKGRMLKIFECRAQMSPLPLKEKHEEEESIRSPNGGVILLESAELRLLCALIYSIMPQYWIFRSYISKNMVTS